jgi:DNA-binding transcriptional LysR family regulator
LKLEFLETLDAILRRGSFRRRADEIGLTPACRQPSGETARRALSAAALRSFARVAQPTPMASRAGANHARCAGGDGGDAGEVDARGRRPRRSRHDSNRPDQHPSGGLLEVHRRYPKLFVRAIQGDSGGLMQHLKTGVLDAAVVVRPTGGGASRFRWVPLAHEPFVLIAPPRSTGNSVSELCEPTTGSSSTRRSSAARWPRNSFIAPRRESGASVEVDSIDTVHALVSAGRGISVVPKRKHAISKVMPVREIALDEGLAAPARDRVREPAARRRQPARPRAAAGVRIGLRAIRVLTSGGRAGDGCRMPLPMGGLDSLAAARR